MGEEEDVEDEEDDEDDLANSDTETVDSLFEDARFPKEEEEVVKEKSVKPKIDLAELVKQDLKKIVTSVEYFDEEKFEGGKKIKSFHKKQKEAEEAKASESVETSKEEEKTTENSSSKSTEDASSPDSSSKRKSTSEKAESSSGKKVKTSSGTFSVSEK